MTFVQDYEPIGDRKVLWRETKERWFAAHPPDKEGFYRCHYCGKRLSRQNLTLDHKLQASRYPQTRYDIANLLPSCAEDNNRRGEADYDVFIRRFYPERQP